MRLQNFIEEFDLFVGAHEAISKIRGLILRLAMRGKLSEPCDDDGTVSDLLRAVEAEKEMLGINRSEGTKDADIDSALLDGIPQGWAWVRFGEIARHNAGKTLDKGRNQGELRDYITTSNLYWGCFQLDEVRRMPILDDELDRYTATKGDLLIVEGGEAGRAAVWAHDYQICFQNHIHRARLFSGINPYFIQRYFEKLNATGEISNFRKGVGISNMSGKALANIPIPLPPVAEQNRIVTKVDELMALCDRLEAQQLEREERQAELARAALARFAEAPTPANLNWLFHSAFSILPADLRKSILTLAVQGKLVPQDPNDESVEALLKRSHAERRKANRTDTTEVSSVSKRDALGLEIPDSWHWQCLEDVLIFGPANGFSPRAVDYETPVRSLALSATTSGRFKGEYSKFITEDIPQDSDLWLRDGDILVQRGNTIEYVGVAAVYRGDSYRFVYPDLMMKLRVSSAFDVDFIHLAMSHEAARDYLRDRASGTSGSMPKINQVTLKSLPLPIPPLAEQRRIVAKVEELMALVDALENQIAMARSVGTSLLAAAIAEVAITEE